MAGQLWSVSSLGGFMYSDNLSEILRTAVQPLMRFRQYCDVKDATGLHKGQLFNWNVYSDVATQGGALPEEVEIPKTNFTITQGSLTITEYGNSVPFTQKLDNLSEHPVKEIINRVMKNDASRTLEKAAYDQFNASLLTVQAVSGTSTTAVTFETAGNSTITNNVALGKGHIKAIVDGMKERNIPAFDGTNYICCARPSTLRTVKNDIESVYQYVDQGFGLIMNGEIGKYEGVRFIEHTSIASEAWSNAKSDAAFFFGEDTVAEAAAVPEEVRGKIPSDYGRSMGVAWYYLGGFGIVHNDGVQNRIVKWDTAA